MFAAASVAWGHSLELAGILPGPLGSESEGGSARSADSDNQTGAFRSPRRLFLHPSDPDSYAISACICRMKQRVAAFADDAGRRI